MDYNMRFQKKKGLNINLFFLFHILFIAKFG
jgi:hypothetical protein